MAKRKSFEDILNQMFRWPVKGDIPFVEADDLSDNANIADGFARLVLMTEGYKKAADLMVEESERDKAQRGWLVFPILFNYRHFLELSLKYQLATYGPEVGVEANWHCHSLEKLWSEFLVMLEHYGTDDPDEVDPVVGEIILEFAKIDPGSFSYRYPVDKKGNEVPVARKNLHLPTLADVMKGVAGYFTGCDGYLSSLKDAY
jgi:hypothetical protein